VIDQKDTKAPKKRGRKKRLCLPRGLNFTGRDLPVLRLVAHSTFLTRIQMQGLAELSKAKLLKAELSEAKLSKAELSEAKLSEAELTEAKLSEIQDDQDNLNRRLRRLRDAELIICGKPAAPFPGTVFSINHKGLLVLERNGEHQGAISSSSDTLALPNQLIHSLTLAEIRLKWETHLSTHSRQFTWWTDRQLKKKSRYEREYAKDYDAVLSCGFDLAIEYERHLKTSETYARIAAALDEEGVALAVIYFTDSPEDSIELCQRLRTKKFPVAALTAFDFISAENLNDVQVLCQASEQGPIWKCPLHIYLNFFDDLPRLHLDDGSKQYIGPGLFQFFRMRRK
jgi:hypothetical protein